MAGAEETGTQKSQKMGHGVMSLMMLGRIQVTPIWENGPVWMSNESRRKSGQGQVRPPPLDGNQAEGGEGRSGLRRVE